MRKLLSTTSLLTVAATLAACSGGVERFGTPGSGFTSNQNEIFTNSVSSRPLPAAVNQPMPAAVSPNQVAVSRSAPVYTDPSYQAQVPVYRQPVYAEPTVRTQSPVSLTTGSINRSSNGYSAQAYPMPGAPSGGQGASQTVYVDVPVRNESNVYASRTSVDQSVLNGPPVVVSRFDSLPHDAPRTKMNVASAPAYGSSSYGSQRMPVSVPVAAQQQGQQTSEPSRFSIARLFSLPKNAPKSRDIDYTSTASITPPNPISGGSQYSGSYTTQSINAQSPAASAGGAARTSGQWTSVGGTMVTVERGEDLQSLSRRYGVPSKAIADVNGLVDQSFVAPGQKMLIPVFQQPSYQNYASNRQPAPQVGAAPMQVASIGPDVATMPFVMRVPKGNPLRLRGQSAYGQQMVKLQQNANAENRHMVTPGETLGGIASRYQVSPRALAQANGMSVDAPLRMGQRLHIPRPNQSAGIDYTSTASINSNAAGAYANDTAAASAYAAISAVPKAKPRWVTEMASSAKPSRRQQVASVDNAVGLPTEASAPAVAPASAPAPVSAAPVAAVSSNANPVLDDDSKFRWPVRGRIISGFGANNGGARNEGINLSVPMGSSIRVAESGTVIYAGDELKMYGNFILVRHPNGWVTAYAHNEKILVSKGQHVRRGQIIAEAGSSGNVTSPQLHFELRIKGDPVDPVPYLI
ncbi:peptidoglycan DD-metalloendopeptidase family protein [Cohaesibacter haloalkalitolerans]|uniref:peptidoglycan DD-metalloendopeptidase family protein n=1 Tax=Cohaesibacter haloalkalitolerans TaxID=1162980 RepID=UPI0013C4DAC2|nr:LysM peptidoglycan-binding domain-containing M23 family metallopeptidase [Cohaesibacter haloalkalitolerans]